MRNTVAFLSPILFFVGSMLVLGGNGDGRASARSSAAPTANASPGLGVPAIYKQYCESCHGSKGEGDGPAASSLAKKPASLRDPKMAEQSDDTIYWHILKGSKPMPPFEGKLSPSQIRSLVQYVRAFSRAEQR